MLRTVPKGATATAVGRTLAGRDGADVWYALRGGGFARRDDPPSAPGRAAPSAAPILELRLGPNGPVAPGAPPPPPLDARGRATLLRAVAAAACAHAAQPGPYLDALCW